MSSTTESFKEKLDNEYVWPALYTFKFIVPEQKIEEIRTLLAKHELSEKASSKGKYKSVTAKVMAESSDYIVDIYIKASKIDGIISL